jgi:hypothetical protein
MFMSTIPMKRATKATAKVVNVCTNIIYIGCFIKGITKITKLS